MQYSLELRAKAINLNIANMGKKDMDSNLEVQ